LDPREVVLTKALAATTTARNKAYGEPEDNFWRIALLWNAYSECIGHRPDQPHDTAIRQILVKIARLAETPTHEDSWVDGAGYFACGYRAVLYVPKVQVQEGAVEKSGHDLDALDAASS
jgi:hypothetical protein